MTTKLLHAPHGQSPMANCSPALKDDRKSHAQIKPVSDYLWYIFTEVMSHYSVYMYTCNMSIHVVNCGIVAINMPIPYHQSPHNLVNLDHAYGNCAAIKCTSLPGILMHFFTACRYSVTNLTADSCSSQFKNRWRKLVKVIVIGALLIFTTSLLIINKPVQARKSKSDSVTMLSYTFVVATFCSLLM